MRKYQGKSQVVLRPKTTAEVVKIVGYCHQQRLPLVPQGGNTGLVGGGVAVRDEITLSMSLMNKIESFDAVSGVVRAEAGCILETLNAHLLRHGHIMPLDLGAKGTCQIGGNVACNAGGLRLLRYGSLRGSVLGLEAVVPCDDAPEGAVVLSDMKGLRKDNTGLDLRGLFVGSEGTLGVITRLAILAPPASQSVNVSMLKVSSYARVVDVYQSAKRDLGGILSAFEFFDTPALDLVKQHGHDVKVPFADDDSAPKPFHILIETSGSSHEHDRQKMDSFLERMFNDDVVVDGAVAQDVTQAANLWALREGIPEACSKAGAVYKYDISLPVPQLYQMVEDVRERMVTLGLYGTLVKEVIGYGHVGDGNLHLNVSAQAYDKRVTDALEPYVYEWTRRVGGSISAEHGLGQMKRNAIQYSKDAQMISMMRRVRHLFDPRGILNPYKYLPDEPSTKQAVQ